MRKLLQKWLAPRDPLESAAQAVDHGRTGIETVLGLPHRLSVPLLRRHFGDDAEPSDGAFRETGRDGYWRLPPPAPEFEVHLYGDPEGRLTLGTIRGHGPYAGLVVFSEWSPDHPAAVWQLRVEEPAGESAQALHDHLLDPNRAPE
ncbi:MULTISPECIES: hypothetical protein [unclassified Thioalkalivibrio]|uniref:hypothetical protein n=1 Tax=unclassified Thioalkalivibrio TaxID=2621013 RepID=UPI00036BF10A|nr:MULTISPECIES: hypothetical protein [unclassified Thioalkalivibrio]